MRTTGLLPLPHCIIHSHTLKCHDADLNALCTSHHRLGKSLVSQCAASYDHLPQYGPYRPDWTRPERKQRTASGPSAVSTLPMLITKFQDTGRNTSINVCVGICIKTIFVGVSAYNITE